MLPSRLFRNTGLPPALCSLITPKPTLPAAIRVQLHLRLAVNPQTLRSYSTPSNASSHGDSHSAASAANNDHSTPLPSPPKVNGSHSGATTTSQALPTKMEPRLSMTFTCTVEGCGERSTHEFTKRAYEKGIVLVQCPGCKNRHLIADHLGWFKESTNDGKLKTVEDLLKAKGEKVKKGKINMDGDLEYVEE